MKRIIVGLWTGLLILTWTSGIVWGQATAQISGSVRDQSGAFIPGVEITATQTGTGISRSNVTDERGFYVLTNLPLGPYRLEAALPGFRTFVQTGIVLQVNSSPVINPVLEVGQISEQVEVQANAAMVETRSVGVGQVIENERILELPLNGRNAAELVVLAGAAVQIGVTGNRNFPDRIQISTAGTLGYGPAYTLDGMRHLDPYDGQAHVLPFPDALEEFKVETTGLSAQHAKAAAVGAVTKSGTNELHGALFEFVRNDLFNARSYFAPTNSTLKRHQFGGTLGGPIIRNKLFFFGGYQGTTVRQDPRDVEGFVPTAAMLAGDFRAIASPPCTRRQITLRAPYVNNRIDPALFSKAALAITSKLPKSSDECGQIRYGEKANRDDKQVVAKIDYQMSDKHSLFGRYVYSINENPHPFSFAPDNVLLTSGRSGKGFRNLAPAFTFGSTYLINANLVNAFRLGASRTNVQRVGAKFFGPEEVGINIYNPIPKYTTLSVTAGFALGGGTNHDSYFTTNFFQLSDELSLVSGAHQMTFGVHAGHGQTNSLSRVAIGGNFQFNGQETGLGLADFLAGRPSSFTQSSPLLLYGRQNYFSLYAADVWKLTPRLTVNYGLRWAPGLPMKDKRDSIQNFSYERFQQGIRSSVFKNAPLGFYYPGDPGFPTDHNVWNAQWLNFGPRLGLAWDPQGDGRTSIRASYALTYEDPPLQIRNGPVQNPPWGNEVIVPSPAGGLENPWLGVPGGNPFPATFDANVPFVPFGQYNSQPFNIPPISISSWNLSVQREVVSDLLVSASYLGSNTIHLWGGRPLNPAIYFAGGPCTINGVTYSPCSTTRNTNARRRLALENPAAATLGQVAEYDTGGTMNYHGMLISVQRRPSRGVTISGNYTLSHCVGDNVSRTFDGTSLSPNHTYQDPNNRRLDRSNCESDRRHIFNMTAVAATPTFANPTLRLVATGWRLSGIYRKSSGRPLTVVSGSDRALSDIDDQRANLVLVNPYKDPAGPMAQYLNPAAFALPALGTYGNLGRFSIKGVGTWQFDVALSRIFEFRENQRLEFRAEAYNLTNSFRGGDPNTDLSNSRFGLIRTSSDPRIMQFALKYVF